MNNFNRIIYLQWMVFVVLFLLNIFVLLVHGVGDVIESADVGELCSTNDDCGSTILYCSSNGVCLCDQENANFLYEFRHHFDIRTPKCEVRRCWLRDERGCVLHGAKCIKSSTHDERLTYGMGICKCPDNTIGTRRPSLLNEYGTRCKEVVISKIGEDCNSNSPVCDVNLKLKCNDFRCECYEGHVFDFESNLCIKRESFINQFGYDKLGAYKQYCTSPLDCNGYMSCTDKKCDCPSYCSNEYIKTDYLCYCPSDFPVFPVVISTLIICGLVVFTVWAIRRRSAMMQQLMNGGNIIIIQPGGRGNARIISPNEVLNLSNNYQIVQQPAGPSAPPAEILHPDAPPSYDEATKQNNSGHNSIKQHYLGAV